MTRQSLTLNRKPRLSPRSQAMFGLFVCSMLTPVSAFAQETQSANTGPQLQDIVVTAQRREQKLQDTPIAVNAFNQETLKASGVANVTDLRQVVPSLNFSGNVGVVYPFLRGVGNIAAGTPGNESSVAVYLDDVYYTRLSPAYLALGDIDRVEVLKGPQGTLFGRNSSGGAIQMFTSDPGHTAEMDATIGYASYGTVSGNVYLSAPLTDKLSWNVAAGGLDQADGWGRNLTTGKDVYSQQYYTVRSKLVWEPTDTTRIKLVGYYANTKGDIGNASSVVRGTNVAFPNWGPNPPSGYPVAPALFPSPSNSPNGFYDVALNDRNIAREHGYGASLRIDQELGFADFVSISAFRKSTGHDHFDDDYLPLNFANVDFTIVDDDISQEFQLKSKRSSKISWIVGAYYLHNKAGSTSITLRGDALDFGVAPGTFLEYTGIQKFDSYAGFAQATAPITDKANLTVGARYTKDDLSGVGTQTLTIPGLGTIPLPGAITPFKNTTHADAFTYRVALDYHFATDLMAYASVSRGYKSGTFNTVPLQSAPNKAEIVNAYEFGVKSELLDRRLRVNGALFWNDIKDPQVQIFTVINGVPGTGLVNAEGARTRGAELEVEALATDGLTLRGSATYVDARYTSFTNAPLYQVIAGALTGPTQVNATGNRMPLNPKWSFTAGVNYKLDSSAGRWIADLGLSYKGSFAWSPDNTLFQGPVTLINASLNFTPESLKWLTLSVFGKNLTNKKYYTLVQGQVFQLGNSEYQGTPGAPQTFGGTIAVKF